MKQTVGKVPKNPDSSWADFLMRHSAIRSGKDPALPRTVGEGSITHGNEFSQLPLNSVGSPAHYTNVKLSCPFSPQRCPFGGACHTCASSVHAINGVGIQRKATKNDDLSEVPAIVFEVLRSSGQPLDTGTRAFFEPRFGHDFSRARLHTLTQQASSTGLEIGQAHDCYEQEADRVADTVIGNSEPSVAPESELGDKYDFSYVRVHNDTQAAKSAQAVNAKAYTVGQNIIFGSGQHSPKTNEGKKLLAHELAHTIQQKSLNMDPERPLPRLQRTPEQDAQSPQPPDALTSPLTDAEWRMIDLWLARGEVGIEPLTGDAEHNADIIAAAIFCSRGLSTIVSSRNEDPLLCLDTGVTVADRRVQILRRHVTQRGPIINWTAVPVGTRLFTVMDLLVSTHHYPANGAAGIAGNLLAESGVLPNRIEGSAAETPLRAPNFAGKMTDFTAEDVMNRSAAAQTGPRMPGIGLAQWTTAARRLALFQRTEKGRPLGSSILFDMTAQVEYLVSELQANAALNGRLLAHGISVNDASDDIVYNFEIPGSILDAAGHKLPRADPAVQAVFAVRRANSQRALSEYQAGLASRAAAGASVLPH